jgi:phenylacetate-CoA ligase
MNSGSYHALPLWAQNSYTTGMGLVHSAGRNSAHAKRLIGELERNERLPEHDIDRIQIDKLKSTLRFAGRTVPYYRELFARTGFDPETVHEVSDLQQLPLLEKNDVVGLGDRLLARQRLRRLTSVECHSSGTTGKSLFLRRDRDAIAAEYAFSMRQYRWAGAPARKRTAVLRDAPVVNAKTTAPPFWRYSALTGELLLSSFHITAANAACYAEALEKWSPHIITAYPSSAYRLAIALREAGVKPRLPHLTGVVTSSEVLYDSQASVIAATLGAPVFDWYGSVERVIFIGTCEQGSRHVFPDYGVTEFLPVKSDGPERYFEMVGTGFINRLMPLIRYRSGDLASLESTACSCGRAFPRVKAIVGRTNDAVKLRDGRTVTVFDPFVDIPFIKQGQIVQESLDRLVVYLVVEKGFGSADERTLLRNLTLTLGTSIGMATNYVGELPRSPNGKYRMVVSLVK